MEKLNHLLNIFHQEGLKTLVTLPTMEEIAKHRECLRTSDFALACGAKPTALGTDKDGERYIMSAVWTATAGNNGKTMQSYAVEGFGYQDKAIIKQSKPSKIKGIPLVITNPEAAGFDVHPATGCLTYKKEWCYLPTHAVDAYNVNQGPKFTEARESGYLHGEHFDSIAAMDYNHDLGGNYNNFCAAHNFGESQSFLGAYQYRNHAYAQYGNPGDTRFNWFAYDKIPVTRLENGNILLPVVAAAALDTTDRKFIDRVNAPVDMRFCELGYQLNDDKMFLKSLAASTTINHLREMNREREY